MELPNIDVSNVSITRVMSLFAFISNMFMQIYVIVFNVHFPFLLEILGINYTFILGALGIGGYFHTKRLQYGVNNGSGNGNTGGHQETHQCQGENCGCKKQQ